MNLLVFSIAGGLTGYVIELGLTTVYSTPTQSISGYIYMVVSFFIAVVIHDVYFYLTHRLLHIKPIFQRIHSWHHKTHHVNAWAAFSFHPIEGIIQIGIVPIVAFVLPISEYTLFVFAGFLLFMSVYGHSGYELRSSKPAAFNVFNTSLHHHQHHTSVKYNFGIYLNLWDRIFKTNHPNYQSQFEALSKRIEDEKEAT